MAYVVVLFYTSTGGMHMIVLGCNSGMSDKATFVKHCYGNKNIKGVFFAPIEPDKRLAFEVQQLGIVCSSR